MLEEEPGYLDKIKNDLGLALIAPEEHLREAMAVLHNSEASVKSRIRAAMILLVSTLPDDTVRDIRNILRRKNLKLLPFSSDRFTIHKRQFAEGSARDVHLLESKDEHMPSFVLKILYCSEDSTVDKAIKLASGMQKDNEFLQKHYDIDGLIPKEQNVIVKASSDDRMAILTIQKFMGSNFIDIFNVNNPNVLAGSISQDNKLKNSFLQFVEKTNELYNQGKIIDIVGKNNLILTENRDGVSMLIFIDPGKIGNVQIAKIFKPEGYNTFKHRMDFLREVYNLIRKSN